MGSNPTLSAARRRARAAARVRKAADRVIRRADRRLSGRAERRAAQEVLQRLVPHPLEVGRLVGVESQQDPRPGVPHGGERAQLPLDGGPRLQQVGHLDVPAFFPLFRHEINLARPGDAHRHPVAAAAQLQEHEVLQHAGDVPLPVADDPAPQTDVAQVVLPGPLQQLPPAQVEARRRGQQERFLQMGQVGQHRVHRRLPPPALHEVGDPFGRHGLPTASTANRRTASNSGRLRICGVA